MTRRLLNIASVLSLLVCLAATVIWALGIHGAAGSARRTRVFLELRHNRIAVALESPRAVPPNVVDLPSLDARGRTYELAGFEYDGGEESHHVRLWAGGTSEFVREYHAVHRVVVPYWAAIAVAGAVASGGIRSWQAARSAQTRLAAGRCLRCGYDSRATPERCPECGLTPK